MQDCEIHSDALLVVILFTLGDSHVTPMHLWLVRFDLHLKMHLQVIFDIGSVWQYLQLQEILDLDLVVRREHLDELFCL